MVIRASPALQVHGSTGARVRGRRLLILATVTDHTEPFGSGHRAADRLAVEFVDGQALSPDDVWVRYDGTGGRR